jgi:hypothetical protein
MDRWLDVVGMDGWMDGWMGIECWKRGEGKKKMDDMRFSLTYLPFYFISPLFIELLSCVVAENRERRRRKVILGWMIRLSSFKQMFENGLLRPHVQMSL